VILGYPWIEHFNPPFDWKNKKLKGDIKVKFEVKYYKYAHTQAIKSFICTSVAVAQASHFLKKLDIKSSTIDRILKIFEHIDPTKSWWVLCKY
jgi:hypothetical protein